MLFVVWCLVFDVCCLLAVVYRAVCAVRCLLQSLQWLVSVVFVVIGVRVVCYVLFVGC